MDLSLISRIADTGKKFDEKLKDIIDRLERIEKKLDENLHVDYKR